MPTTHTPAENPDQVHAAAIALLRQELHARVLEGPSASPAAAPHAPAPSPITPTTSSSALSIPGSTAARTAAVLAW